MPAVDTALRVLHWAVRPEGQPPTGDARSLQDVLALPPALAAALRSRRRGSVSPGCRVRPATPALGLPSARRCWALAIGVRERPEATEILRCCQDAAGP